LYQYKSKEAQMPQSHIKTLPLRARPGSIFANTLIALTTAVTRRRERQRLARLDAHLLRDIGLGTQDAAEECAKPFWRS
jgi:uncharacterized protein YjiS (DUF1127 family)